SGPVPWQRSPPKHFTSTNGPTWKKPRSISKIPPVTCLAPPRCPSFKRRASKGGRAPCSRNLRHCVTPPNPATRKKPPKRCSASTSSSANCGPNEERDGAEHSGVVQVPPGRSEAGG